jgi:hypothetical protein
MVAEQSQPYHNNQVKNLKLNIILYTPIILHNACLEQPCLSNELVHHIPIKHEVKKERRHLCANTRTLITSALFLPEEYQVPNIGSFVPFHSIVFRIVSSYSDPHAYRTICDAFAI